MRVSVTSEGAELKPFVYSEEATVFRDGVADVALSGNGLVVAFESHANGLVEDDLNNNVDIFVHELTGAVTERASVATGGGEAYDPEDRACGTNGSASSTYKAIPLQFPAMGVTWHSSRGAPNLYRGDRDPRYGTENDVFVHDRRSGTTLLVNRFADGSPTRENNLFPGTISEDGRWITYASDGERLAPGAQDDHGMDVFLQHLPNPFG